MSLWVDQNSISRKNFIGIIPTISISIELLFVYIWYLFRVQLITGRTYYLSKHNWITTLIQILAEAVWSTISYTGYHFINRWSSNDVYASLLAKRLAVISISSGFCHLSLSCSKCNTHVCSNMSPKNGFKIHSWFHWNLFRLFCLFFREWNIRGDQTNHISYLE